MFLPWCDTASTFGEFIPFFKHATSFEMDQLLTAATGWLVTHSRRLVLTKNRQVALEVSGDHYRAFIWNQLFYSICRPSWERPWRDRRIMATDPVLGGHHVHSPLEFPAEIFIGTNASSCYTLYNGDSILLCWYSENPKSFILDAFSILKRQHGWHCPCFRQSFLR